MIYLIGGAPRCGKSTIAKKLSKKISSSWISADALESIASVYIPGKDHDKAFPKYVIREKTKFSNDIMYSKYSAKEITRLYVEQSKTSFPAVKALVEVAEKEGDDQIIEGHQVQPKLISDLIKKYGKIKVKALVLVRFDVKKIVAGAKKNKAKNDWFIQKTDKEETYPKIAQMIAEYSSYLKKEANKYDIESYSMDGDFDKNIDGVIRYFS